MRINLQFIPDAIHNLWINSNVPLITRSLSATVIGNEKVLKILRTIS